MKTRRELIVTAGAVWRCRRFLSRLLFRINPTRLVAGAVTGWLLTFLR
jgi:hypothetical protein